MTARAQWASQILILDGESPTKSSRLQQSGAGLVMFHSNGSITKRGVLTSFDADGFTMGFDIANANAVQVVSLAVGGVPATAGAFAKTTAAAPAAQTVPGVPFRTELLLFASVMEPGHAAPVPHARFGLGATAGAAERSMALSDTSGESQANAMAVHRNDKAFVKIGAERGVIEAELDSVTPAAGAFTLRWERNDPVPIEILYLGLGAP
jgi:hypothetical protein